MRFDPLLNSFYFLSYLWGGTPGPQVCPASSTGLLGTAYETVRLLAPRTTAGATAFVNVNVVPLDRERVLANQTVLIDGGRITALGPAGQVKVPAGAVRVDGRGKYLMPGLADMHSHFWFDANWNDETYRMFSYLANGVTTVRNIDGVPVNQEQMFRRLKSAEVLTPRLYLTQDPRRQQRMWKTIAPDSTAAYAAAYKVAGFDFVELPTLYERALPVLGLPVADHTHGKSFERMLAVGAVGGAVEHMYAFEDSLGWQHPRLQKTVPDAPMPKIRAMAIAMQRSGVWMTPTLNCKERYSDPSRAKVLQQIVKALQDAGVGLLLGVDADEDWSRSPSMVHEELASLVGAGLTPYQALLTGTRNVAQYFRLLDSSGTVTVGKWADLVLLNGNPFTDIRYTREPAGVMSAGRWLDRVALDQGLLASPKAWLTLEVGGGVFPKRTAEQTTKFSVHLKTFNDLIDSLAAARSLGQDGLSASQRARRRLAEELGMMRAVLTPEQHRAFDPKVRLWLREQTRQGPPSQYPASR